MNKIEYNKRSYFTQVGLLMTIVSLAFLYYMGSSMAYSAKRYHQRVQGMEIRATAPNLCNYQ